jgi:hypothetical protein
MTAMTTGIYIAAFRFVRRVRARDTGSEVAIQRPPASPSVNINLYCFTTVSVFQPAQSQFLLPLPHQPRTNLWYISFYIIPSTFYQQYASDTKSNMSSILSAREQEMACYIWQTMKSTPEVSCQPMSLFIHKPSPNILFSVNTLLLLSSTLSATP